VWVEYLLYVIWHLALSAANVQRNAAEEFKNSSNCDDERAALTLPMQKMPPLYLAETGEKIFVAQIHKIVLIASARSPEKE
jgi:hypothetical protein